MAISTPAHRANSGSTTSGGDRSFFAAILSLKTGFLVSRATRVTGGGCGGAAAHRGLYWLLMRWGMDSSSAGLGFVAAGMIVRRISDDALGRLRGSTLSNWAAGG